jgi:hypothetical protein
VLRAAIVINDKVLVGDIRHAKHDKEWERYYKQIQFDDPDFTQNGSLILRQGHIYVPNNKDLQLKVLQSRHDHKLRGHPGVRKTRAIVMRDFFWSGITKDVKDYVKACPVCRRAKSVRAKPYGFLKTLPIPERTWSHLSMDHIGELPESNGFNAILVVVCRLSKQAIFIPAHTTDTTEDLVQQFITHVFSKHGTPISIISDRGSKFVAEFWKKVCAALGIRSHTSTSYHPETDGQTERVNQVLEQYLRIYINYLQDDWTELLPIAEFVYNNTPHDSTGMTPFFANKGSHPAITIDLGQVEGHEANQVVKDWDTLHSYLKQQVHHSYNIHAEFSDRKRRPTPNWQVGEKVYLNSKNIQTKRPSKKFDHKNFGPFKILAKIGTHAYRLEIPKTWRIHDVFHVNLLSKDHPDRFPNRSKPPPPTVEVDGEQQEVVERILNQRWTGKGKNRHIEYLVKWKGYDDPIHDEWMDIRGMHNARQIIKDWHRKYPELDKVTNLDDYLDKARSEGW